MRNARLSVVGLLVFIVALGAASSARGAVVTFPTVGITATTSTGVLSYSSSGFSFTANVTLGGAVYGGSYTSALGSPLPLDIASFIASRCTSTSRVFAITCLTSIPIPWLVGTSVGATTLTMTIPNVRIQVDAPGLGISCLAVLSVVAVYDRTTGRLALTATRDVGRTGLCPSNPRLTGMLFVTPIFGWTLTP